MKRGDVVRLDFPFTDVPKGKKRPALVVQNDRDNQKISKTVVAMITGNFRRLGAPSHFFIDPSTPEGASSDLNEPSLVSCNNLYTVDQACILQILVHLADMHKKQLNDCLKAALELT
jgi:mRNA-degrading endonuclease toxin of MazEF toxin-antitoxin module